MSRSGYSDDIDQWSLIRWRGAVASAIRGKRGQALLAEMLVALDAMPAKELIAEELEFNGQHCALGVVGQARGLKMDDIDVEESFDVAAMFGVSEALVREIACINDDYDGLRNYSPEERWANVRDWVSKQVSPYRQ